MDGVGPFFSSTFLGLKPSSSSYFVFRKGNGYRNSNDNVNDNDSNIRTKLHDPFEGSVVCRKNLANSDGAGEQRLEHPRNLDY